MAAVRSLCSRGILLRNGKLFADDTVSHALELYLQNPAHSSSNSDWRWDGACPGDDTLAVQSVSIQTSMQNAASEVSTDEAFQITIQYEKRVAVRGVRVQLQLVTATGEIAFTTTDHSERSFQTDGPGIGFSTCSIPARLLNVGRYAIRLAVDIPMVKVIAAWFDVGVFDAVGHHNGGSTFMDAAWPGVVSPRLAWSVGGYPSMTTTPSEHSHFIR